MCFILQNFTQDFNAIYVNGAFEGANVGQNINRVVIEHFLRQGQLDIAESLIAVLYQHSLLLTVTVHLPGAGFRPKARFPLPELTARVDG